MTCAAATTLVAQHSKNSDSMSQLTGVGVLLTGVSYVYGRTDQRQGSRRGHEEDPIAPPGCRSHDVVGVDARPRARILARPPGAARSQGQTATRTGDLQSGVVAGEKTRGSCHGTRPRFPTRLKSRLAFQVGTPCERCQSNRPECGCEAHLRCSVANCRAAANRSWCEQGSANPRLSIGGKRLPGRPRFGSPFATWYSRF